MVVNGAPYPKIPPTRPGRVGDDPNLFWYPDTGYIRSVPVKTGDVQYGGTYSWGSPMGNVPAPSGATPWGVQVGTGERAIAPPGSEKYAGQEYIGGVGLTGGGFTGTQTGDAGQPFGRYYQTPEDKFTELQTKLGLNQPEVRPWLIPPSASYEGLPNPAYAGRAGNVLPGQQGAAPKYTMMPRQGETTTVPPMGGGGQGEVPPPEERMTYEQARYATSLFGGTVAGDDMTGYYVVPPRVTMGPATVRLPETNWEKTLAALFSPTMPPDFWRTGRGGELQRTFPIQTPGVPPQTSGVSPQMPGVPPVTPTAKKSPEQEASAAAQKFGSPDDLSKLGERPKDFPEQFTDKTGAIMRWDSTSGKYVQVGFDPTAVYQAPVSRVEPKPVPPDEGKTYTDKYGNVYQINYNLNAATGTWDRQADELLYRATAPPSELEKSKFEEQKRATAARETAEKEAAARGQAQQEYQNQLALMQMMQQRQQLMSQTNLQYQMQQQALGAQREQRLAELAANPSSWLEYAALSGQPAKVQPWMLPLGYEQYGFKIGQEIPGTAGATSMAGLPELTTPSAQYAARMTPAQRQQYRGYQRAQRGITPADTEFYLWGQAPGGGGIRGLSYQR